MSQDSDKSEKSKATRYALSFFIKIFVTACVVWVTLTWIAGIFICHTNSAFPSIRDGDLCVTYRLADIHTGTMIIYRKDGEIKFGRVVAFSGDKVEIFQDFISVNDYGISDESPYPTSPDGSAVSYPYYVPDSCVFVMNDYRNNLSDSRTYGGIPLEDVQGAVIFIMRMRGI